MRGVLICLGAVAVCWTMATFAHMYREKNSNIKRPTALETIFVGASVGMFAAVLILNAP